MTRCEVVSNDPAAPGTVRGDGECACSRAAEERKDRVYAEVEIVLQYLKGTRARAEAALADLRANRGEAFAVVNSTPSQKPVGDKGVDGVVRFFTDAKNATGRAVVSVKGGDSVGPQFVRDLLGTIETQKAELGLLIRRVPATRGMVDAADHAGTYIWPVNGEKFTRIQPARVGDLLAGKKLKLPPTLTPHIQALRARWAVGTATSRRRFKLTRAAAPRRRRA
jgi:hypothetical protein